MTRSWVWYDPLLYEALVWPHLEYSVQGTSEPEKAVDRFETGEEQTKGLERLIYEVRLKLLNAYSLLRVPQRKSMIICLKNILKMYSIRTETNYVA